MSHRPTLEPLESRQLLSVTWINRGTTDRFAIYGDNAATARTEVDAAIADWNHVFPKAKLKLTITAADLSRSGPATLGLTKSSRIQLDDDGATKGWYFDPALDDDAEHFKSVGGPDLAGFNGQGDLAGKTDFYTAALHEIAHALGYKNTKHPFIHRTGKKVAKDPAHTSNVYDLMYPTIPPDTRRAISLDDVDHVSKSKSGKAVSLPSRFFYTNATTDQPDITLTLDGVSDYSSFTVYRSTGDNTGRFDVIHPTLVHTGGRERSWTDTDVSAGTPYHYWVSVTMSQGPFSLTVQPQNPTDGLSTRPSSTDPNSNPGSNPNSNPGSNPGTGTPAFFSGPVNASQDKPYVSLAFSPASAAAVVDHYAVYRSTTNNGTAGASGATVVGTAPPFATHFIDTTRDATQQFGHSYYYWVVAVYHDPANPDPNALAYASSPSALGIPVAPGTNSNYPIGTVRASTNQPDLTVTWDAVPGATAYALYTADPAANPSLVPFDTTTATADTIPAAELGSNTRHYTRVWVTAETPADPRAPVGAASGYTANFDIYTGQYTATRGTYHDFVRLQFSAGPYGDGVDIYRSTADNGSLETSDATLIATVPGNTGSYDDHSAALGQTYYYWIVAYSGTFGPAYGLEGPPATGYLAP